MNKYYNFEAIRPDTRFYVIKGGRYMGKTYITKRYFVFLLIKLIKRRIAELSGKKY